MQLVLSPSQKPPSQTGLNTWHEAQLGRPVLVTMEDEMCPCPCIKILIQSFELSFILGIERMIVTTRDSKTARPSFHTTTAFVYRFPLQHHQSRSTTSS